MGAGYREDPPRGGRRGPVTLPRLRWVAVALLTAATFAVIASRPGAPPPPSTPTGDVAKARQAIDDLLAPRSGRDPIADLPADFTAVTGHTPVRMPAPDGTVRAVHPGGGCSSPWGDDNTRWDYSVGCKAHDLGYDLLRYADAKGQPLGPDLRERLDDRLSADMHAMCDINPRGSHGICEVVASLYSVGLVANSWHQRWGPPRSEPIGPWSFGLIVIALLIAAAVPVLTRSRRRPAPGAPGLITPTERDQARYLGFLRILSLTGIVLAESILALADWGPSAAGWIWPLTWALQLVPLFFLAGGQANLLAWRAAHGYSGYLTERIGWLIRPVLAFVAAWLVVPLSLELLRAPEQAIAAFGRIVLQPLWLLGLYLLVVAALPAMLRLHRRFPILTPLALLGITVAIGLAGRGSLAAHAGGIVIALLFQQLAFHYADGRLWRLPRPVLLATAGVALLGLIALTTAGGYSKLLIAEPTEYASFAPSLLGMLLVGLIQVCLVALPRERGVRAVAGSAVARGVAVVRNAPVTTYLFYLCTMLLIAGMVVAARTAALPSNGADWITQPRRIFALALIGVPTLLAFLLIERRATPPAVLDEPDPEPAEESVMQLDVLAAALGVAYGALGILGFTATGITGSSVPPSVFGLPLDPMGNLIHLLLGWYLLHCVRIGTSGRPWPWLLTAIACLGPMVTMASGPGTALHGATLAVALGIAAWRLQRVWLVDRAVPEGTR